MDEKAERSGGKVGLVIQSGGFIAAFKIVQIHTHFLLKTDNQDKQKHMHSFLDKVELCAEIFHFGNIIFLLGNRGC